ncbi:MAG: ATP-dependent Clp protease adaptor ClpS [Phycisphaeraceae bacterium]|nr:ATP-dependent Clp protease adaptor ClpS [Phycisphaeraceae bacterium]MBX3407871.1 ATP-dependent Clp protease adaptor ClpS [Phycisphaeraceae bacterium]
MSSTNGGSAQGGQSGSGAAGGAKGEAAGAKGGPMKGTARPSAPMRALPQFRVLLHNDDVNELRYVVRTIIELTRMDSGRAMQVTVTAHTSGVALVLHTHRERAELYREQFAGRGLRVSVEPA